MQNQHLQIAMLKKARQPVAPAMHALAHAVALSTLMVRAAHKAPSVVFRTVMALEFVE
jgi:hypothetical protein